MSTNILAYNIILDTHKTRPFLVHDSIIHISVIHSQKSKLELTGAKLLLRINSSKEMTGCSGGSKGLAYSKKPGCRIILTKKVSSV